MDANYTNRIDSQFYKMIYSLIIIILMMINYTSAQYYQPLNPYSYDTNSQLQSSQFDSIEQKYVNSGQSIVLICDLPNSMPDGKVLFIKYDSKVMSSGSDIREDGDDERYEIGQQYAWEWSLKINSINEDDSGIYVCKVSNVIIKQFEIIVRVPPRIKEDLLQLQRSVKEGGTIEFSCFASGTPRPNITWFVINQNDQSLRLLPQSGNYLKIENVTRYSPRRYQCKASNNIPPSDTRNFTFTVEFAPEIEIQSKLDSSLNTMTLNCTINAFPLTNRYFWRKDGNYINDGIKHEIRNTRLSDYLLISQLIIKHYGEFDQGLYECTAENDLRVSKIVYSLKDPNSILNNSPMNLVPIGNSKIKDDLPTSTLKQHHQKNRKQQNSIGNTIRPKANHNHQTKKNRIIQIDNEDSASLNNIEQTNKNQRKQQRNHNKHNKTALIDRILSQTSQSTSTSNYYNSPYVILINDDNSQSSSDYLSDDKSDSNDKLSNNDRNSQDTKSDKGFLNQPIENSSSSCCFNRITNRLLLFIYLFLFAFKYC